MATRRDVLRDLERTITPQAIFLAALTGAADVHESEIDSVIEDAVEITRRVMTLLQEAE